MLEKILAFILFFALVVMTLMCIWWMLDDMQNSKKR